MYRESLVGPWSIAIPVSCIPVSVYLKSTLILRETVTLSTYSRHISEYILNFDGVLTSAPHTLRACIPIFLFFNALSSAPAQEL